MNELTQAELLERVNTSRIADGNPRVREITARIVSDLFKTIDQFDVQPDEFWAAVDWFSRLGSSGQTGLITAGLGFDRLLDIREDEADRATGRAAGTPRAAYSTRWRTRFHADGGQCSSVMADSVPR